MGDDSEATVMEMEGQRARLGTFGAFHGARRQGLGKRLLVWYGIAIIWLIITITTYCFHTWYFKKLSCSFATALTTLAGSDALLNTNQVLLLYYTTKFGLLAILLIPLVWIFKRITHIQALRSVHADKEILANTLETLLYSGIDDVKVQVCEIGFKEVFSSSCDIAGRRGKRGSVDTKIIKEILEQIKLFTPKSE